MALLDLKYLLDFQVIGSSKQLFITVWSSDWAGDKFGEPLMEIEVTGWKNWDHRFLTFGCIVDLHRELKMQSTCVHPPPNSNLITLR